MRYVVLSLACVGLGASVRGLEPMLIINEDNDHYFKLPAERMNVPDLEAYIDRLGHTKVTHFFMCPNGQRTSYRSSVHEAIWDPIDGDMPQNIWCLNAKRLHDQGIDPYDVWIRRCRMQGLSPWVTMRMNDVHFVTTRNYFRNSTFWRDHPELWRVPHANTGRWTDYAFDYSRQEVRDYHLALVRELLERYDMDGLELDWMRFGRHLTPGLEREQASVLTEFTRQVRQVTLAWAARRGHPIGLSARLPSHPEAAAGLGMDGVAWARQGLVDLLVVSPFFSSADLDIPVELWQRRLEGLDGKVHVIPAIDNGVAPYPGAPRVDLDLAIYDGWAAALHHRGARSFYLFNLVYRPTDKPPFRSILERGLEEAAVLASPRRYPLAYRDTVPEGFPDGAQLPALSDRPLTFSVPIGRRPVTGQMAVLVGLADRPGVATAAFDVALNGVRAVATAEASPTGYGGAVARMLRFAVPVPAACDGVNTISVASQGGEVQRLVWVEVEIVP